MEKEEDDEDEKTAICLLIFFTVEVDLFQVWCVCLLLNKSLE